MHINREHYNAYDIGECATALYLTEVSAEGVDIGKSDHIRIAEFDLQ